MSDYLLCEVVHASSTHKVNVPTYILTDAIDDGLSNVGVEIEVRAFLETYVFSSDDFYLTTTTLKLIDKYCDDHRSSLRGNSWGPRKLT